MKNLNVSGNWKDGKNTVKVNLPVMIFQEDNVQIAYVPVLDLSGYGKNEAEALASLDVVLKEYFSYGIRKNTLIEDLKAHGWTVKKKTKPYIAPEITDLINKNEYLHDIVNSRPYKMERIDVDMPQYA
jgi:hypothetical protein